MSSSTGDNLYERFVGTRLPAAPAAPPPARPSASVVPWRRAAGGSGVEVYWAQRAPSLPFMGGWHAFPGGAFSRSDAAIPVHGEPGYDGPSPSEPEASGPDLPPGIAACGLRELFEEVGLLVATPETAPAPGELPSARAALLAGETPFAALLERLGTTLDASRLVYAGRWLTPPFAPLRFDNRFFLLEWPASEAVQPEVHAGEFAAGEWIDPAAAFESWRRGEVLAAPPILHILQVLAEEGPVAGLPRLRDSSEANLGPFRRVELRPGVVMLPLATLTLPPAATTNAILLGTGDCVLVDPGSPHAAEQERLLAALDAAREKLGRRVTAIWLTHHHPDHVAGVEALRRALGVPVLAHPLTAERLAGHGIAVDAPLEEGQRIELARGPGLPPLSVLVLHTPGHARGHLCFLEEGERSLLAGDMVAGIGTIVVDPPEGDMDDYLGSLARLAALRPKTLFPAHGPAIKDAEAKLREYLDHRLWREERILAAWQEGLREPAAMLPVVYDDVPPEAHPIAARQIQAHLERLRRGGRISS
jgi:ribonuclease/clavin/mitogillin